MTENSGSVVVPFSDDVRSQGGYLYTVGTGFSTILATRLQTEAIVEVIRRFIPDARSILDIGCGDGTYTVELARRLTPVTVHGFDPSAPAIAAAQKHIPSYLKKNLSYTVGSIYRTAECKGVKNVDCGVVRGVLHHLDNAKLAFSSMAEAVDKLVVLEPNGYNPMLKIIEKTSPYHIRHGEKSYFPPHLVEWAGEAGFRLRYKRIFSTVPYFFPESLARMLWLMDPVVESVPVLREICCGTIILYFEKEDASGKKDRRLRRQTTRRK